MVSGTTKTPITAWAAPNGSISWVAPLATLAFYVSSPPRSSSVSGVAADECGPRQLGKSVRPLQVMLGTGRGPGI